MYDIKEKIIKTETIEKEITISGKLYDLFIKWVKTKEIREQKRRILSYLQINGSTTLEVLSKELRLSLPLISYHVNGNINCDGLFSLETVSKTVFRGKVFLKITKFGKLILEMTK